MKRNSRADKAGIRKGDKLKRINDIKTETLTLQEAHDIILESGIYIRLAVTAYVFFITYIFYFLYLKIMCCKIFSPEDTDTSYSCYQDEEVRAFN